MPPSSLSARSKKAQQKSATDRSHRSPEWPRGNKSRRTLIQSACTSCQKRKSRCDGRRPVCSRCQKLQVECIYNAEQGESRMSALRRKNSALERERDEAQDLITQIRSRPELEAQEVYRHIRENTHASDLGAFIHEATNALSDGTLQQQQQPSKQQHRRLQHQQQSQPQQSQRKSLQQHPQQQEKDASTHLGYNIVGSTNHLPPLRSVIEVPTAASNTTR